MLKSITDNAKDYAMTRDSYSASEPLQVHDFKHLKEALPRHQWSQWCLQRDGDPYLCTPIDRSQRTQQNKRDNDLKKKCISRYVSW